MPASDSERKSATRFAMCLVRVKTSARVTPGSASRLRSTWRLSLRSTCSTDCSTRSAGVATGATATRTGSRSRRLASASIARGIVAEKSSVCRSRGVRRAMRRTVCDEAHVEHAVGLVEDDDLDVAQIDAALLHQVEQPARRRDEDVHAARERRALRPLADAAEDHGVVDAEAPSEAREGLADLARQLARRREHECADAASPLAARLGGQVLEDGQRERRGLAGARLRAAEQVAAREHGGNRLTLDGRGDREARIAHRAEEGLVQVQVFEVHGSFGALRAPIDRDGAPGSSGARSARVERPGSGIRPLAEALDGWRSTVGSSCDGPAGMAVARRRIKRRKPVQTDESSSAASRTLADPPPGAREGAARGPLVGSRYAAAPARGASA